MFVRMSDVLSCGKRYPAGEVTFPGVGAVTTIVVDVPYAEAIIGALQLSWEQDGPVDAVFAYLPAARADKPGNYDILGMSKMIASGNFSRVTVVDPHSEVSENALISACAERNIPVRILTAWDVIRSSPWNLAAYDTIVAPDKGAVRRAKQVADNLASTNLVICEKERDQSTGRIIRYRVPEEAKITGDVLVVDDICDGGKTFEILFRSMPENTDLYVTHGVFSGDALQNLSGYRKVFTTDSLYSATLMPGVEVFKMWSGYIF